MITKALICYALSVVIAVLSVVAVCIYFKKSKMRFSVLNMLIGTLSFFAAILVMILLVKFAFSSENTAYMAVLMTEKIYKIAVAVLFFAIICLVRYFILNAVYFSRGREDKGASFLAGFGLGGAFTVSVYSLFSFIYLAYEASVSPLVTVSADAGLTFADNTVISVFTPLSSHVYVTLLFVVYTAILLVTAKFMTQHATLPYKPKNTVIMYLLTSFCEVCLLAVTLFSVSRINYIVLLVISLVFAAIAAASVKLLYTYKEELPYNSQFE